MNSLDWRIKKLEAQIVGRTVLSQDQQPILEQLENIAKHYASCIEGSHQTFPKFQELYNKHKQLLVGTESLDAKKAIVLAYEKELVDYMQDLKTLAEKADKVLDVQNWPDMTLYKERVDKLQKIVREQHIQSTIIDKRTEELIEIYNDIIGSFKRNIETWDQKLEAHMEDDGDEIIKPTRT